MRTLFTSSVELLLPGATYLVLGLSAAAVLAWAGRSRWPARWRWGLLALCAWAWVLSTPALANLWLRHLEGPPPTAAQHDADVPRDARTLIVVLASGDVSGRGGTVQARLDLPGWERLLEGVALWRRSGGTLVLVGGAGDEDSIAAVMARRARELGVPESALQVHSGSTRTHEDLMLVAPAVRDHAGPVWLVTSAMHMPRAAGVAARLGLAVQPRRCDYQQVDRLDWGAWLPNAGGPARFAAVLHEAAGLLYYRVRGWA
jgi:uncharacterized SAM-binding protein YcdF (DUF218 family)